MIEVTQGDTDTTWRGSWECSLSLQPAADCRRLYRYANIVDFSYKGSRIGPAVAHTHAEVKQTVIGHDVWIGMDVLILEGITIGTGAVIGAQSLIAKDVPPYAIVVGSPAKVQRYRFDPQTIEGLLASQWWNLTPHQLADLPMEDPVKLLEALKGFVVPDSQPGKVVVRNKPFSAEHHPAQ